jgi:hypothetical protein
MSQTQDNTPKVHFKQEQFNYRIHQVNIKAKTRNHDKVHEQVSILTEPL